MLEMPVLTTQHLVIRPFVREDLPGVHHLLDVELWDAELGTEPMQSLEQRAQWLQWIVLNYRQLAQLRQPPYGDRAVILRSTGQLIGACGYVPCLNAFEQLPGFGSAADSAQPGRNTAEVGLFYAISPGQRRRGYASEAARALVDYAFRHLRVKRIVATTDYDNVASMGVMARLGMRVERNPRPEPAWLQVVGVLETDR